LKYTDLARGIDSADIEAWGCWPSCTGVHTNWVPNAVTGGRVAWEHGEDGSQEGKESYAEHGQAAEIGDAAS